MKRRADCIVWAFLVAQMVKNPPAMWDTSVRSLGWEDALQKGMATHSNISAWRIPRTEEPGRLQSMGSQRVRNDWATFTLVSLEAEGNQERPTENQRLNERLSCLWFTSLLPVLGVMGSRDCWIISRAWCTEKSGFHQPCQWEVTTGLATHSGRLGHQRTWVAQHKDTEIVDEIKRTLSAEQEPGIIEELQKTDLDFAIFPYSQQISVLPGARVAWLMPANWVSTE